MSESADIAEKVRRQLQDENFEKLKAAGGALFGGTTQEQAQLQLKIAQTDAALADLHLRTGGKGPGIDALFEPIEAQRSFLQERLEAMLSDRGVLQAAFTASDKTLLTNDEQERAARDLITANFELSGFVRQTRDDFRDLIPELHDFLQAIRSFKSMTGESDTFYQGV